MSWEYFSYEGDPKLACSCCGNRGMDHATMLRLDRVRRECGFALPVSSGYRCPDYNAQVSSTGSNGPHTTGHAVDIRVSGAKAQRLIEVATAFGFVGIGVAQKGPHGSRFIHLDDIVADNRPWVWSY